MKTYSDYRSMILYLTLNCNLGCPYCFCGRKFDQDMSEETLCKSMEFFNGICTEQNPNITFFGGEPLLKMDLIKYAVHLNETKYDGKFGFSITTNGTLLTRETADFLRDNQVGVLLSLDGDRESHDRNRFYKASGRGSWDDIIRNVKNNMDRPCGLRLTFTPENVGALYHNISLLYEMGFENIAFYPACGPEWTEELIDQFEEQFIAIAKLYESCYEEKKNINIHWIDKSIRSHILDGGGRCKPGIAQFSVTPSGEFYPCNRTNFADPVLQIGTLETGLDYEMLEKLDEELNAVDPDCQQCALKNRCNACPMEALAYCGNLFTVPEWFCDMNQRVILLSDKIAERLYKNKNPLFFRRFYHRDAGEQDTVAAPEKVGDAV